MTYNYDESEYKADLKRREYIKELEKKIQELSGKLTEKEDDVLKKYLEDYKVIKEKKSEYYMAVYNLSRITRYHREALDRWENKSWLYKITHSARKYIEHYVIWMYGDKEKMEKLLEKYY